MGLQRLTSITLAVPDVDASSALFAEFGPPTPPGNPRARRPGRHHRRRRRSETRVARIDPLPRAGFEGSIPPDLVPLVVLTTGSDSGCRPSRRVRHIRARPPGWERGKHT